MAEISASNLSGLEEGSRNSSDSKLQVLKRRESEQVRVRRRTLEGVLVQCQKALELLKNTTGSDDSEQIEDESSSQSEDCETAEFCDLLKSRVDSPDFLEKLGSIHASVPANMGEEGSSWDVVNDSDLWEGEHIEGGNESDQEEYVVVGQEDIVEAVACFMAAYLLSLKQTKDLTPNQLQEALSKTFSIKKKKGKLQKAWDGSKVIYNVASWSATAIGIYQNPALFRAASMAFWTSCRVVSKML